MIREKLKGLIAKAVKKVQVPADLSKIETSEIVLERPKEKKHGDWATNVAMVLASQHKVSPTQLAKAIIDQIADKEQLFSKIEVAGPGFINFYLSNLWLYQVLAEIDSKKDKFGYLKIGRGQKVQLEFVSANPVGPMHVGHGRWAAVGDSLANVMSAAGYKVQREFYVNDYGTQMDVFARSVEARYLQILGEEVTFPEDGYKGSYIKEIAAEIVEKEKNRYLNMPKEKRRQVFQDRSCQQVLDHIEKTLLWMEVKFDRWFSESELYRTGAVEKVVDELREKGYVYEKEGAVWLRTTAFGDDKDRVLIRETGEPTYFAADIAYHKNKFDQGFERVVNIWGADHHGYVKRIKAAIEALGYSAESLEIIIGQLVNLWRGGQPVRMSKRTGEMVTLEELLQEVGKDAARYFFLMRGTDSPLDFDIELAKQKSQDNPVYYVQYAHARICSILRFAKEQGVKEVSTAQASLELLKEEPELDLIRKLAEWPEIVEWAALNRAPYPLTRYAQEVATVFHYFYTKCRVVSDDKFLSRARLVLVKSTRQVLSNVLSLLGVSAPERM